MESHIVDVQQQQRLCADAATTAITTGTSTAATTTTPPGSTSTSASTLPMTENGVCKAIQQILNTAESQRKIKFALAPTPTLPLQQKHFLREEDFCLLLEAVDRQPVAFQTFWFSALRFDYYPSISTFIFRMPPLYIHEAMVEYLEARIRDELQSFKGEWAREIEKYRSTRIQFGDGSTAKFSPDISYRHKKARHPGFVAEIAYSQKDVSLAQKADDYIQDSMGSIRTVVGVDIAYPPSTHTAKPRSQLATVSVWKASLIEEDSSDDANLYTDLQVEDLVFRNSDGTPNSDIDAGIWLGFNDFVLPQLEIPETSSETFFISARELFDVLSDAENTEKVRSEEGMMLESKGGKKITNHRRSLPSAEQISIQDELKFKAAEDKVDSREDRKDKSFHPRSGEKKSRKD